MTPEMQLIQQLLIYVLFTGFFTGIFFSHRLFDLIDFVYRFYKWRKRKNHVKFAKQFSLSEQQFPKPKP